MNIQRILEQAGLKPTALRVSVMDYFHAHADQHIGADEIFRGLNSGTHSMSLAAVYLVLGQLVEAQLLCSIAFGNGRLVYELNDGAPHDHVFCTACGNVREFFDAAIDARLHAVTEHLEFAVSERRFVLFGLCADCKETAHRPDDPSTHGKS